MAAVVYSMQLMPLPQEKGTFVAFSQVRKVAQWELLDCCFWNQHRIEKSHGSGSSGAELYQSYYLWHLLSPQPPSPHLPTTLLLRMPPSPHLIHPPAWHRMAEHDHSMELAQCVLVLG